MRITIWVTIIMVMLFGTMADLSFDNSCSGASCSVCLGIFFPDFSLFFFDAIRVNEGEHNPHTKGAKKAKLYFV